MEFVEWIAVVASVLTVLSVILNIYQFLRRRDLKRMYYSTQFAAYNNNYRVAELVQTCHALFVPDRPTDACFQKIVQNVEQCIGIVDSVRSDILAFTERYLGLSVWRQHPAHPDQDLLQRTKRTFAKRGFWSRWAK